MAPLSNRRSGADRRQENIGPPSGVAERRRLLDRRQIVVEEVELTETDWETLFHVSRAEVGPFGL